MHQIRGTAVTTHFVFIFKLLGLWCAWHEMMKESIGEICSASSTCIPQQQLLSYGKTIEKHRLNKQDLIIYEITVLTNQTVSQIFHLYHSLVMTTELLLKSQQQVTYTHSLVENIMKERRSQRLAFTSAWQTHCVVFIFKMSEDSVQEFQSWCVGHSTVRCLCVSLFRNGISTLLYCAFFSFSKPAIFPLNEWSPLGLQKIPYCIQQNLYFQMCPVMADQQDFGVLRRSCKCPKIVLGCAWCHTRSQFK